MADSRPIGIFDSGIGGLSIAQHIRQLMPTEDLIYLADSSYAPYGEKTEAVVLQRAEHITQTLLAHHVKAIVVACNTATMIAIRHLRAKYSLPFIGVEPGVKPAAANSKTGVIGVLATSKTLVSDAFKQLSQRVAHHVQLEIQPCPDLVILIEALKLDKEQAAATVAAYIRPLLEKNVDSLILGCTHFSHLKPLIEEIAGPAVTVISTEQAVAKETLRRLNAEALLTEASALGNNYFLSNGDLATFSRQIDRLWPNTADIQHF